MKPLCLSAWSLGLLLLASGCSSSASVDRPEVETTSVEGATDFAGVVEGGYYTPVLDGEDPASKEPIPGVRYVRRGEYEGPSVVGGQTAIRNALSRVTSGFTCPVRGRVYVIAMISDTGDALSPRVTGSIHPDCDARALTAFTQLRFSPARSGGEAVAMPLTLPVHFQ